MDIQLTPQQQVTLDAQEGKLPRLIDPRTKVAYVLVPESEYVGVREILDEERRRQAIHSVALRNAAGRIDEAP